MNLLVRIDRAQLAAVDAAVAWLWNVLGVPRRMLLRMALVGQFACQAAAEYLLSGRVHVFTLLAGALVMGLYHLNDRRFGANPELQRAFTLMRRETPLARFVRVIAWTLAGYDFYGAVGSPVWPLETASIVFFLVFMIGGDALPPGGPRRPGRRARRAAAAPSGGPVFGRGA